MVNCSLKFVLVLPLWGMWKTCHLEGLYLTPQGLQGNLALRKMLQVGCRLALRVEKLLDTPLHLVDVALPKMWQKENH